MTLNVPNKLKKKKKKHVLTNLTSNMLIIAVHTYFLRITGPGNSLAKTRLLSSYTERTCNANPFGVDRRSRLAV